MAKLTRVTAKIFGETASTSNTPKEIGQFGSAKAGTYNATGDVCIKFYLIKMRICCSRVFLNGIVQQHTTKTIFVPKEIKYTVL